MITEQKFKQLMLDIKNGEQWLSKDAIICMLSYAADIKSSEQYVYVPITINGMDLESH